MKIDVHVYVHNDDRSGHGGGGQETVSNAELKDLLLQLLAKETIMTAQFDALTAAVAQDLTVSQSAITLINGIAAQIAAVANDPIAAQALADSLTAQSTALAAAVTANTPAAPPPGPESASAASARRSAGR